MEPSGERLATLTIKNIPGPLVKRLKEQAAARRRSLNFQVISYLEQMTHSVPIDADALLARARALRRTPKGTKLTDRILDELKVAGRSMIVADTNLLIYLYIQGQRTEDSRPYCVVMPYRQPHCCGGPNSAMC